MNNLVIHEHKSVRIIKFFLFRAFLSISCYDFRLIFKSRMFLLPYKRDTLHIHMKI